MRDPAVHRCRPAGTLALRRAASAGVALVLGAALASGAAGAPLADPPCTWHVRLSYHYRETGLQGTRDTRVFLELETPLRCAGSAAPDHLARAGPTLARGSARSTGNVPHAGGGPGLRDIFDRTASWPAPQAASGDAPDIEVPAPSFVGEGFGTQVTIAGALSGTEQSAIADPDATARDAAAAGDRRALQTAIDPPARTDRFQIALTFDPLPGTPSDAAGTLAQVPQRTSEALKVPGGEAALALKGHLFGALTRTNADGTFSVCYQRSLALAPAALEVDYCGWLTRPGADWQPEHLPRAVPPAIKP